MTEGGNEGVVGLDTESVNGVPVLIQMSTKERCVIVKLHPPSPVIPVELVELMKNGKIVKAGAGLLVDTIELYRHHKWTTNGIFDFHYEMGIPFSLAHMFSMAYECVWEKEIVNHNKWKAEDLSLLQIKYAALDAWTSYAVGIHKLQNVQNTLVHLSPLPAMTFQGKHKQIRRAILYTRGCRTRSVREQYSPQS